MSRFKIGDKVEVVKYGHVLWMTKSLQEMMYQNNMSNSIRPENVIEETEQTYFYDALPEVVGKIGTVDGASSSGYSLNGIPEKHAWYNEDQLKKII